MKHLFVFPFLFFLVFSSATLRAQDTPPKKWEIGLKVGVDRTMIGNNPQVFFSFERSKANKSSVMGGLYATFKPSTKLSHTFEGYFHSGLDRYGYQADVFNFAYIPRYRFAKNWSVGLAFQTRFMFNRTFNLLPNNDIIFQVGPELIYHYKDVKLSAKLLPTYGPATDYVRQQIGASFQIGASVPIFKF